MRASVSKESTPSRRRMASRGQSMLEMALLLPILLLILGGILDLGRVFYAYVSVLNAAREGARYASLHPSDLTPVAQRVIGETGSTLDLGSGNYLLSIDTQTQMVDGSAEMVTVTVGYSATTSFVGPVTQLVSGLWGGSYLPGNSVRLQAVSAMPVMVGAP